MASQNSMGLGGVWGGLDYHKGVVGTLVRCDHWFLYDPILCVRGGLTKTDYHLIASNKTYFHSPLQRDCFSCLTTRHKELNELINVSFEKDGWRTPSKLILMSDFGGNKAGKVDGGPACYIGPCTYIVEPLLERPLFYQVAGEKTLILAMYCVFCGVWSSGSCAYLSI